MRRIYKMRIFILLPLLACEWVSSEPTKISISNYHNISKPTFNTNGFDYIIFGIICEECYGESSRKMYKLDLNKNKLYVDRTRSFYDFPWGTPKQFDVEIIGEINLKKARQILDCIPKIILDANADENFGYDGSDDSWGLFLQTKRDTTIRTFFFPYTLTYHTGDIKNFADCLRENIAGL
jgi:hypothetical protein